MAIEIAVSNEDAIIWQIPNSEDEPIPEPAIMIKEYSDMLGFAQDGKEILVNKNRKNINQLIKLLKSKADGC